MPEPRPEWYYVGHYGQLGPLTEPQLVELIEAGVVERQTYVWRAGMSDWVPAASLANFVSSFSTADIFAPPPAPGPKVPPQPMATQMPPRPEPPNSMMQAPSAYTNPYSVAQPHYMPMMGGGIPSDKSRVAGGLLNLFLPGVGRIYLGYSALGVIQLLSFLFCGVGIIWSFIDGIIILAGGLNYDGYGRKLS